MTFKKVIGKIDEWYDFKRKAFSNALNGVNANKEPKGLLGKAESPHTLNLVFRSASSPYIRIKHFSK